MFFLLELRPTEEIFPTTMIVLFDHFCALSSLPKLAVCFCLACFYCLSRITGKNVFTVGQCMKVYVE